MSVMAVAAFVASRRLVPAVSGHKAAVDLDALIALTLRIASLITLPIDVVASPKA